MMKTLDLMVQKLRYTNAATSKTITIVMINVLLMNLNSGATTADEIMVETPTISEKTLRILNP